MPVQVRGGQPETLMAALGTFIVLAAFVVCSYAASVSVVGARRRSRRLVESGIAALHLTTALLISASAVMVDALLTDDFSVRYVARFSEISQPAFFKITSYWGGLDGSLMLWVFLLSIFGSLAVHQNRERHRELVPYVVATVSVVEMFFLNLITVHNSPFSTFLTSPPSDGSGLTPGLQSYWMAIHPPTLYTGFVSMTIPYAFGMAALMTGQLDDAWLRAVRRWTMFSWLFLSFGLALGMLWAYEELGWGGFWNWDPVENAALLPWFTATAFLHSVIVQERRRMLRIWNLSLVIVTFFLTIFGTFLTRSGVVSSMHAFGLEPTLAWLFTAFMLVSLTVSFGLLIYRLPVLRAPNTLESIVSREAAFVANNWILLFSAFFVLFATMFPTLSEAVRGERITVASPFYNRWMTPIGLVLLMLTGIGPLLGWRKGSLRRLAGQLKWPAAAAMSTAVALLAAGSQAWVSAMCFSVCAFVAASIGQEFWRAANVRRASTGTDLLTALVGLVALNKRRYGGYIVHLGIVLAMLGFGGQGFRQDRTVVLKPGDQTTVGRFRVTFESLRLADDGRKQIVAASLTVFDGPSKLDTLFPAKWYWHKHADEPPTSRVSIRRRMAEDLYIALVTFDASTQAASFQLVINPLVNWIWLGVGMLAFGSGIALLPDHTFRFRVSATPATTEQLAPNPAATTL